MGFYCITKNVLIFLSGRVIFSLACVSSETHHLQRVPLYVNYIGMCRNDADADDDVVEIRVRTGHGKPRKPWNLRISFSRPGIYLSVLKSHGK